MSRKKNKKYTNPDPTLSHGVIAILLVVFAIICMLSFFDKAGTIGIILNQWILSFLFGTMRYSVPAIIIIYAWYLITQKALNYKPSHGIGSLLFFIATSSLLHLQFRIDEMWLQALEGRGGGVFGMLAWILKTYLGEIASYVLLSGVIAISLILIFNTTLGDILQFFSTITENIQSFFSRIIDGIRSPHQDSLEEEYDEDEEEEYDEDEEGCDEDEDEDEEECDEDEDEKNNENEDDADKQNNGIEKNKTHKNQLGTQKERPCRTHTVDAKPSIPAWQKQTLITPIPSLKLLETRKGKPSSGDTKQNEKIIKETLNEFRISVNMGEVKVGPTVTQYSFKPAKGVKVSRITSLSNDLSLALAAHPIRIEAPIPGKSMVGIEVPNNKTAMVSLKELITSQPYKERPHNMMVGLGKDVGGKVWFADLPKMPHLLIAGSTGSGKTVCMNTIITSLLYQNTAETLRMIMIDPKRVELTLYNGIPHLLTPVITDVHKTVNALKWTISEMDRRFDLLSKAGNRDITSYNKAHPKIKLPHLVFVIDELADLMVTASNDVETGIIRLAQMARAVGIHLIVATQRPSVDVITGLMKANIPGRIAFSVASIIDSRTILDSPGAEKLVGKGDMLLQTAEFSKPIRIQGAFISEEEVKRIVKYLRKKGDPVYAESITEKQTAGGSQMSIDSNINDQDSLFEEAKELVISADKASASFLQRRLKVGYARAARIIDELEEAGIVGPANGAKPREILATEDDIDTTMGAGGEHTVFNEGSSEEVPQEEEEEEGFDHTEKNE